MPSTSEKQARFMAAAAHDPAFAKRAGISQSVAHDFNQADKGTALLRQAMMAQELRRMDSSAEERGEKTDSLREERRERRR